jgi:hypothetical protein
MNLSRGAVVAATVLCTAAMAQMSSPQPRWWTKYQYLAANGATTGKPASNSVVAGANVDVSNECGPQSETFVAINSMSSNQLAGGSNEIFRSPMRGYYSTNGGQTWGGVDLPLPPVIGNGFNFGSDPGLAFDTRGNAF